MVNAFGLSGLGVGKCMARYHLAPKGRIPEIVSLKISDLRILRAEQTLRTKSTLQDQIHNIRV